MKHLQIIMLSCMLTVGLRVGGASAADMEMLAPVTDKERCPVCGMFIARYTEWLAQMKLTDGRVVMFDGPKDMLAYYFSPAGYGGKGAEITDIRVRDYYSQQWIDGRTAHYVTGSDVYGPMGAEFVPFDVREAAENFLKDHHGNAIFRFDEITIETVQNMRKGHTMKTNVKQ